VPPIENLHKAPGRPVLRKLRGRRLRAYTNKSE
jgi:hypothetical protein